MKLFIARHGETQWNVEGRFQGKLDSPLTGNGLQQIELMKNFFKNVRIGVIYSSDLGRAVATSKAISDFKKIPLFFTEELREISYGVFEGLNHDEIDARFPGLWEKRCLDKYNFKIPEGESYCEVFERAKNFLEKILKKHENEAVLLVSHGCMSRMLIQYFINVQKDIAVQFGIPHDNVYEIDSRKGKIWNINLKTFERNPGLLALEAMNGTKG